MKKCSAFRVPMSVLILAMIAVFVTACKSNSNPSSDQATTKPAVEALAVIRIKAGLTTPFTQAAFSATSTSPAEYAGRPSMSATVLASLSNSSRSACGAGMADVSNLDATAVCATFPRAGARSSRTAAPCA